MAEFCRDIFTAYFGKLKYVNQNKTEGVFGLDIKLMGKREFLCLLFGSIFYVLSFLVKKIPAFEDQEFIRGLLMGASAVILLQGVYFIGRNIAALKRKD